MTGQAVNGEPAIAGIAMQPEDDAERAAIFRAIESAARVRAPGIPLELSMRWSTPWWSTPCPTPTRHARPAAA